MSGGEKALFTLKVPATTANLGAGFDTLGMALTLYNIFSVTELLPEGEFSVQVLGEGALELSDWKANMVIRSYCRACSEWNIPPRGFRLVNSNAIPVRCGLGSSSTAVVAGVMLAKLISGLKLPRSEMLRVMTSIEGHPDNVVPCTVGGMTVSCWDGEQLQYVKMPALPDSLKVVAVVPNCQVSTEAARSILPPEVPFRDAVFNVSHAALLCAAWSMGRWDLLSSTMDDRLHQTYRASLIPGGADILNEIRQRPGCAAVAISGSGPTMVALARGGVGGIAKAMCSIFARHGVTSHFFVLNSATFGTRIERGEKSA